jgi:CRISPR-associated exonuclease Cas4
MMDDEQVSGEESGEGRVEVLISAIEHYSYCPRQCALIHVDQTYDENLYTIRGRLMHERVDSGDDLPSRGVETQRGIPLWSEHYDLRGKADAVEWHNGVPYPEEYKVGRRHGAHTDVQLCAQALCLEEMLGVPVRRGAIFYHAVRRRHEIAFDEALRQQTEAAVTAIRAMLVEQRLPMAANDARCRNCSLINSCLPSVVAESARLRGLQGGLFWPLAAGDDDA